MEVSSRILAIWIWNSEESSGLERENRAIDLSESDQGKEVNENNQREYRQGEKWRAGERTSGVSTSRAGRGHGNYKKACSNEGSEGGTSWSQKTSVRVSTSSLSDCMTLGDPHHLSEPLFSHL